MGAKKKVLLVGGCAALAHDPRMLPWRTTVDVLTAADGASALAVHRNERADLLVMDLDLPDGPAEQLCDGVRADQALRRVSLLVLCGADEAERRRAADCRANAHIVRPAEPQALAEEITRLLSIPQRALCRVLARVTLGERDSARSFFCTSENVSATGILVETEELLHLGDVLDCSFFLPGRLKVATQGKVVREACTPNGRQFGIQFLSLPDQEAEALGEFVAKWGRVR